jgi:hypothetical protein
MAALQAGEVWRGEILLRRRDDTPVLAFVLDVPVGDLASGQGAIVGVSGPADEAARIDRQAEELAAALRRRFTRDEAGWI